MPIFGANLQSGPSPSDHPYQHYKMREKPLYERSIVEHWYHEQYSEEMYRRKRENVSWNENL